MSLPYQIADRIDFDTFVCTGQDKAKPIVEGNENFANVLDILVRSDPTNAAIAGYDGDATSATAPPTWIWVGSSNIQPFPLKAGESINFRVTTRSGIYYRGPVGHKLIVVSAKLNNTPGDTR